MGQLIRVETKSGQWITMPAQDLNVYARKHRADIRYRACRTCKGRSTNDACSECGGVWVVPVTEEVSLTED